LFFKWIRDIELKRKKKIKPELRINTLEENRSPCSTKVSAVKI
jgi:hypothetical protein